MVSFADEGGFISIKSLKDGTAYSLKPPVFEVDGSNVGGRNLKFAERLSQRKLLNGGTEWIVQYHFADARYLKLLVYLRCFPDSPIIRYRYVLVPDSPAVLTKKDGKDGIEYTGFKTQAEGSSLTEIQFSQFDPILHSFVPAFQALSDDELVEGCEFPGPITFIENNGHCCLMAYEHGAQYPDTYIIFNALSSDGLTYVSLKAHKGNYYSGQVIDRDHPFVSVWFQFGLESGYKESLLRSYREFFLKYISENTESRKPYIFYNTWNYQERNRYYRNLPYLYSMHQDRIMKEIDVAHQMGVDVFVIDTGWYNKTGDWIVNDQRFPDMMESVKEKLDSYKMKLGLWFNPIVAARTSKVFLDHPEYVMSKDGKENFWGKIWETEESYGMCLASGYSNYFIEKMVQMYNELGVTYFKWDAIGQYGCNSPRHNHGTEANSPEERLECYSYQMGMEMIRIVEEVTRRCPEAIVDFDITEGGRFVGLGFLGVGKYFLMNNGPYFKNFDIPEKFVIKPDTINVFFHPGAARPRVCRQGIRYDSFVPSILFLTHFLPDKPELSQWNSLCSLMLGGNGIWGDLLSLDRDDIEIFRSTLDKYKKVSDSVVLSYPRAKGFIGSSPEIYEKVLPEKAEGLVCFFTQAEGSFTHVTKPLNKEKFSHVEGADHYDVTGDGRLKITVNLKKDEARPVFVFSKM